jgi:hypothetical protein
VVKQAANMGQILGTRDSLCATIAATTVFAGGKGEVSEGGADGQCVRAMTMRVLNREKS